MDSPVPDRRHYHCNRFLFLIYYHTSFPFPLDYVLQTDISFDIQLIFSLFHLKVFPLIKIFE